MACPASTAASSISSSNAGSWEATSGLKGWLGGYLTAGGKRKLAYGLLIHAKGREKKGDGDLRARCSGVAEMLAKTRIPLRSFVATRPCKNRSTSNHVCQVYAVLRLSGNVALAGRKVRGGRWTEVPEPSHGQRRPSGSVLCVWSAQADFLVIQNAVL